MGHSPPPAAAVLPTKIAIPRIQASTRASSSNNPPAMIARKPKSVGIEYSITARKFSVPRSAVATNKAMPNRLMIPSGRAKTAPPSSKAVVTDAAMGTLRAVATRKITRTTRLFPGTVLADHVNCDHGNHINKKSSAALPAPVQSGSWISSPTSCENANTNARSKNSSTGSAE